MNSKTLMIRLLEERSALRYKTASSRNSSSTEVLDNTERSHRLTWAIDYLRDRIAR